MLSILLTVVTPYRHLIRLRYAIQTVYNCTPQHTATRCNTLRHARSIRAPTPRTIGLRNTHGIQLHITTHRSTLQHAATRCNTHAVFAHRHLVRLLYNTIVYRLYYAIQTVSHRLPLPSTPTSASCCEQTATHCNTLQHTAAHSNTRQHPATPGNTLQHTATHCNTLQHTATHCNTLQHTRSICSPTLLCLLLPPLPAPASAGP